MARSVLAVLSLVAAVHTLRAPAPSMRPKIPTAAKVAAFGSMALQARPALAAAKAGAAVPFTLLGRGSAALFPVQNLAIVSWACLFLVPGWRHTQRVALISPTIHAILYSALLVHLTRFPPPGLAVDFSSLEGIMRGFATADGAFAGWLHYCVFDPLVGLGIVLDARQNRVPHLFCVPCLLLTMFAGPMGFVGYLLLRNALLTLRKSGALKTPTLYKAKGGKSWEQVNKAKDDGSFKGF